MSIPPSQDDPGRGAGSATKDRPSFLTMHGRLCIVLLVSASIASWYWMQSTSEPSGPVLMPARQLEPISNEPRTQVASDLPSPPSVLVASEESPREALQQPRAAQPPRPAAPKSVEPPQDDIDELPPDAFPVLVSGWVTDSVGLPIEDVWVLATVVRSAEERPAEAPQLTDSHTDTGGRFEIRGNVLEGKLSLRTFGSDHSDIRLEVTPVRHDVVLVLPDAARLSGTIVVDEGIDPADLSLALVSPQIRSGWQPDSDGSFEHSPVPIGRSMLVVCAHSWIGPSLELLEIDVEPGVEIRLDPIDLRGRLMTTHLIIEGPDGGLANDVIVRADPDGPIQHILYTMGTAVAHPMRIERDGSTGPVPSRPDRDGRHRFFHAEPIEVEIDAQDLRAMTYTLQGGADRLRLGEGFDVELRLIGTDKLPPTVRTRVTFDRALARQDRGSGFRRSSYLRFKLRSPGTWIGRIHVASAGPDFDDRKRGQEFRVEVLDVTGVQRFDIHLDERTLEPARELARSSGR